MADKFELRSVQDFRKVRIPHNDDDLETMSLEFTYSLPWLEFEIKNNGKTIKYVISSVIDFAEWLIKYDNLAVKDDWGYIWNGSYWAQIPVKQVFNLIDVTIINITDRLKISNNKKRELQRDVKAYIQSFSAGFDNSVKENYIAFKNWTLNIKQNNFFTPKKELNVIGGFDFEPDANKNPDTWIAYTKYMFGENAKFVWAWLGYAFQANMEWKQGALFLLDPIGGTGKTYFITKITEAMFGANRVGAFKLKNLQGNNARFETAKFVNKAVMIDDDATRVRFKEDDVFKSVTGGGLSPIERKGVDGAEFKITAKMIINVNEMPIFNNAGAIKRRLHIVKTVAPAADGNATEIAKRNSLFPEHELQKEVPRLATYAIEQYQEAVKSNLQIENNIVDDMVAIDPFIAWHDTLKPGEYAAKVLYDNYVEFYDVMYDFGPEEKPMSERSFGRKMTQWHRKKRTNSGNQYVVD
ncbi:phage / plasmid primase, P4 [Weissella oryzae SG25]|uniref:Phage / plasmid primase, P4 n=1 Tax=Weissella oryzae (strain DSM 25784 / JCM 18191 / LMG 30913 / SG25) TaxID=1329250 RepID=A0A069D3R3_WEIOS|nr:DUF5906 domain-containing protein [Weissella oryzae]GAK32041.1 phage / plasmid primase, P4 [Weissella oryzae SG25]